MNDKKQGNGIENIILKDVVIVYEGEFNMDFKHGIGRIDYKGHGTY
jgi:hypothetical protein